MDPETRSRLSLRDAWRLLPFSARASCLIAGSFILVTLLHVFDVSGNRENRTGFEKIAINGETATLGVFDPSIAFSSPVQAWLAYTAVFAGETPENPLAEIHLAQTNDAGRIWHANSGAVFSSRPETLYADDGVTPQAQGIVRYETPGLVYDPADKGREWKLFAYRYFWNGDKNLSRNTSIIALKYAQSPTGPWSKEIWMFGAGAKTPPPPYDRLVLLPLSRLHPSLADVEGYSDPAPFLHKGRIYMLLTAFTAGNAPTRLLLIASNDHGNSWYYAGSPLSVQSLKDPKVTRISGGSFVEHNGRIFLMAAFGDDIMQGRHVRLFEVADLARARLVTETKTGKPAEAARINPPEGSFLAGLGFGSPSGDPRLTTGFLFSHMIPPGNGTVFNILTSGKNPLKKD